MRRRKKNVNKYHVRGEGGETHTQREREREREKEREREREKGREGELYLVAVFILNSAISSTLFLSLIR